MNLDSIFKNLPALFAAALVAILFIQSALDKVFDWKGNLGWLTGHFSKTFLAPMVPMMLATITVMELTAGFLAAAGIIYFLAAHSLALIFWAAVIGSASITALFFGQRVAKDYPGAAVLVPYFILLLILMLLTNPYARFNA
ncbi:MAG: DoxX family protein [Acidobacteriota bacterium]